MTTSACFLKLAAENVTLNLESSYGGNAGLRATQVAAVSALFGSGASATANEVAVTATSEPTELGRAEWIKFIALFFNQEQAANQALF